MEICLNSIQFNELSMDELLLVDGGDIWRTITGVACGVSGAFGGAIMGATAGAAIGNVPGAVIGGIAGGVTGGVAGYTGGLYVYDYFKKIVKVNF